MKRLIFLITVLLAGCSGDTGGGDPTNPEQPSQDTGSMSLSFTDGNIVTTGAFTGFRVKVKDANGRPSTNVTITCDTQRGLALIEPTSGFGSSDGNGEMSGKVGCNNPGSFLIACRSGSPGSRQSATIICEGNRPAGFTGFPGAGGGGLGGGSSDDNNISSVIVTSLSVSDTSNADAETTSIDITQGVCGTSPNLTAEPFTDSAVIFNIKNNSNFIVKITKMRYKLFNPTGSGGSRRSGELFVTGNGSQAIDSKGGIGKVSSLLFKANNGGKFIHNGPQISSAGFKNITFTLFGENELGEKFTIKTATSLSFGNFNRCSQ